MDQAPEVLRFLREYIAQAPDEVGLMANLRLAPSLPIVPEHLWGKPIVALIATYAGPIDDGHDALAPIHALSTPAFDALTPKPYVTHQKMFDPAYPHGRHYYWKAPQARSAQRRPHRRRRGALRSGHLASVGGADLLLRRRRSPSARGVHRIPLP